MSVLRGTFRLSVVVALVALLCSVVYAHFTALDAEQQAAESWRTLHCGQMFLNRDMRPMKSVPQSAALPPRASMAKPFSRCCPY
jgi:hypothetical protein